MSQLPNLCNQKKILKLFFYVLSHCNIALVNIKEKLRKKRMLWNKHHSEISKHEDSEIIKSNAILVIAISIFALGFPAAEYLLDDWDVITVVTVRNLFAFVLLFFIWIVLEGSSVVRTANWIKGFWIGGIGFGIGSFLLLLLQSLTTPVIAALAAATMPLAAVTLEVFLDGRRITQWFLIGIILVLFGGFLATGATFEGASFGLRLGTLLVFIPAAIFAWGSRATVKNLPGMTSLGQTTITTFGMAIFTLVLYVISHFLLQLIEPYPEITIRHFGLLLIYAWLGFAISQIFWIRGVSGLGIGIASFHLNALPFYVMLFLFLLGESWNWQQAIGAAIVTTGVILSQIKSAK